MITKILSFIFSCGPSSVRVAQGGFFSIITDFVGGMKSARTAEGLREYAEKDAPFIKETSKELQDWASQDWDRFKTNYRPVSQALVGAVNKEPDIAGARGKASGSIMSQRSAAERGLTVSPNAGGFRGAQTSLAGSGAAAEVAAMRGAEDQAQDKSFGQRLGVVRMMQPGSPGTALRGLDLVASAGKSYGKYADQFSKQAGQNFGKAAQGLTEKFGSNSSKDTGSTGGFGSSEEGGGDDYRWSSDFADGGLIEGQGTGTSDSIPAKIDGHMPARVSDGEYEIPPEVVEAVGVENLEKIRMQYHQFRNNKTPSTNAGVRG